MAECVGGGNHQWTVQNQEERNGKTYTFWVCIYGDGNKMTIN